MLEFKHKRRIGKSVAHKADKGTSALISASPRAKDTPVRFGDAKVSKRDINPSEVSFNITAGQKALKDSKVQFMKAGIRLARKKGVPLFRTNPANAYQIIRELDGRVETGVFENGQFCPLSAT